MTGKEFMNSVAGGKVDILQAILDILRGADTTYCVIGGLAVNAYAEPVVSLDLDLVVVSEDIPRIVATAQTKGFTVEQFEHSVNLSMAGSDLRIQLQTDPRYQDFRAGAQKKRVLGYELSVASLQDVLKGKIWAYSDPTRRKSKRQKDLADIMRLVEAHPEIKDHLPPELQTKVE